MDSEGREGSSSDKVDISNTLAELLNEVKSQKAELFSLRNEVRGSTASVSSEVKKLKTDSDFNWRFEGNKTQYKFNGDILDSVTQIVWALDNSKFSYSRELLSEVSVKLKQRNKLIRIADTSEGGWETVRQYQCHPVASDSDDESKIRRAEARAVKKKKDAFRKKSQRFKSTGISSVSNASLGGQGTVKTVGQPFLGIGYSRGPGSQPAYPKAGTSYGGGACFSCGEFTHYRRDCPYTGGSTMQVPTQVVSKK